MSQEIEKMVKAAGLTAPRISADDVEANIDSVEIVKHISKSGQVLRWVVITTKCGFAVTGKPSCAVSAENDNQEIGEKVAISNARSEMWELMGYELKARMFALNT